MQAMINRTDPNNTLSTEIIDLNSDTQNYYLSDYGFFFGVSITDINGIPVHFDSSYFTLEMKQSTTQEVNGYKFLKYYI